MGAWDVDSFDNDMACDWAYELEGSRSLSVVQTTLEEVLDVGGAYLESDLGCTGLAACEVLARLKGNWGKRDAYTETVDKWVEAHPQEVPSNLIDMAVSAIDRIVSKQSELAELWAESDATQWQTAVNDLRERVAD